MEIDHRKLLIKYINHVGEMEGVNFIRPEIMSDFSDEEISELETLEQESYLLKPKERINKIELVSESFYETLKKRDKLWKD